MNSTLELIDIERPRRNSLNKNNANGLVRRYQLQMRPIDPGKYAARFSATYNAAGDEFELITTPAKVLTK
jgi:hypothetical protein